MERFIVVEGKLDAVLIDKLMSPEEADVVGIAIAGGKAAALPLANSLAVAQGVPVALVIDANTINEDLIREQEIDFQDFVDDLQVDCPPVLILGKPTVRDSVQDPEWLEKIRQFIEGEDYAAKHPFSFRR